MKIRSVTCFYDPTLRNGEQIQAQLAGLAKGESNSSNQPAIPSNPCVLPQRHSLR